MSKHIHRKCGNVVSYKNVTKGYKAQCPKCDEDLYSFEMEEIK
jgi:uncharacterized paraquat-inducible protein A